MKKEYPGVFNIIKFIALKYNESVLILTDKLINNDSIKILENALSYSCSSVKVDILPQKLQADFPPNIRKQVKSYDVIFLAASQSWYQAPTRSNAKHKLGKRVIECYDLQVNMLIDGALCADYKKVGSFTDCLMEHFKKGSVVNIFSNAGTKLKARFRGIYKETGCYDKPGSGGNMPAGEISLGLVEKSAEGEIVFDLSFDCLGRLEKAPLKITVIDGKVSEVQGKYKENFDLLIKQNKYLSNIAEIGIGTNPYAILHRSVLEDEKKLGTVHIGFGNDTYFGGNTGGLHLDGVIDQATITVDEKVIMADGKYMYPLYQ